MVNRSFGIILIFFLLFSCKSKIYLYDKGISKENKKVVQYKSLKRADIHAERIEALNLSNNNLIEIDTLICKLHNLKYLNLSNNSIDSIPECLYGLKQMEVLMIANNNLTSISNKIENLGQLKMLVVRNNYLDSIPESISNISQLQLLDISENRILKDYSSYLPEDCILIDKVMR